MINSFDELTKSLAQSVTRRGALKKFGVGIAGPALAAFVLANKVEAHNQCQPWLDPSGKDNTRRRTL